MFKAACLNCKKYYETDGSADECGQCHACNYKDTQYFLSLKPSMTDDHKLKRRRKQMRRIMPSWLSNEELRKIRVFFYNNFNVKFTMKNQAYSAINEEFGLNLTSEEVLAICTHPIMCREGLDYNKK